MPTTTAKIEFFINVYFGKDHTGCDWWESLKTDGSTRTFKPLTSVFLKNKYLPTLKRAKAHAQKLVKNRFQIIELTPPPPDSITYGQRVVFDTDDD